MKRDFPSFRMAGIFILGLVYSTSFAQQTYWQQHVSYRMEIDVDAQNNRIKGVQKLTYTNNSTDTLKRIFYHLYWNAHQPNSTMAVASKFVSQLKPNEIGYQKVVALKMDEVYQQLIVHETILEVVLNKPILPGSVVNLDLDFEAQVPLVSKRGGRGNSITGPGVTYTMGQWYPKLCEYDKTGWNLSPYIGNGEFYGVWGDFDVTIHIDKKYFVGGTGYLQNPDEVDYDAKFVGRDIEKNSISKRYWHFKATNVHDFMWSADADYNHIKRKMSNGTIIHFFYKVDTPFMNHKLKQNVEEIKKRIQKKHDDWNKLADAVVIAFPFIENNFGTYPYKQYSFMHGGGPLGGMEYPMSSSISSPILLTALHELIHSWYPMMVSTNEAKNAWMDEGFTTYATNLALNHYWAIVGRLPKMSVEPIHKSSYDQYFRIARSLDEEPLITPADHFETFSGYVCGSYGKGAVFLEQLGYIVGAKVRNKILLEYYRLWKFKHPDIADFIRVAENVSGIKLDWYQEYFINTIKTIDYGIDSVWTAGNKTKIKLSRTGKMPMPVDLIVKSKDGNTKLFYIPMSLMYGLKPDEDSTMPALTMPEWKFNAKTYEVEIDMALSSIAKMEIDPTQRMADINRSDNQKIFK